MTETERQRPAPALAVNRRMIWVGLPASVVSLACFAVLSSDARAVALPMLCLVNIAVWFLLVLWNRDRALPVFELGTVWVAVTLIYSAFPLLAFLLAGMQWTAVSDVRLVMWHPSPGTLGGFAWRYVVYLMAFVLVYVPCRGRWFVDHTRQRSLSRAGVVATVALMAVLWLYFALIWLVYGVSYDPSYVQVRSGTVGVPQDLPYLLQQISHNLAGILLIVKVSLLIWLMQRWRSNRRWGLVLGAWLALSAVQTVLRMGARTELTMMLMASVLLYHRLVRPLTFRAAVTATGALVTGVVLYGFARDFGTVSDMVGGASSWSAANEFQVLLSTGYDLHARRTTGLLGQVPWQIYVGDFLNLVPSQLLPFAKLDPSEWYLDVLGVRDANVGLLFGVIAQAVIGFDWIELAVRGAVLGLLTALVHRWYASHAENPWATLTYVCLCLWCYHGFRVSTFYVAYFVLYRLVPMIVIVRAGTLLGRWVSAQVGLLTRLGEPRPSL